MKTVIKVIQRILALPFVFGIFMIKNVAMAVVGSILFLMYGGELISYTKNDKKTIYDIYCELKKQGQES